MNIAFTKGTHVCIDLETLSTRHNAAIVSIGACRFTFDAGVVAQFKVNIDPLSCKNSGLHIDKNTVEWWSKQSKEARKSWQTDPESLTFALETFNEWFGFGNQNQTIWCEGGSFDFPIMSSAYTATGLVKPWKHHSEMDMRTTFKLVGFYEEFKRNQENNGHTVHDALADAVFQTEQLLSIFSNK